MTFTVWVGGVEVNDFYLSEPDAIRLAEHYLGQGYDDVQIERVN
jgi:hypothetical protein